MRCDRKRRIKDDSKDLAWRRKALPSIEVGRLERRGWAGVQFWACCVEHIHRHPSSEDKGSDGYPLPSGEDSAQLRHAYLKEWSPGWTSRRVKAATESSRPQDLLIAVTMQVVCAIETKSPQPLAPSPAFLSVALFESRDCAVGSCPACCRHSRYDSHVETDVQGDEGARPWFHGPKVTTLTGSSASGSGSSCGHSPPASKSH